MKATNLRNPIAFVAAVLFSKKSQSCLRPLNKIGSMKVVTAAIFSLVAGTLLSVADAAAQFPGNPQNVLASNGPNPVTITWSAASGTVNTYSVYRSTTNVGCNGTLVGTVSGSTFTINDATALTNNVYYYSVNATNGTGTGNCSFTDDGWIGSPPPPFAPESISATENLIDKVQVTWVNPSGGQPITSFRIFRSSVPSYCVSGNELNLVSYPTSSFDDTTAVPGTVYYYSVQSSGPSGVQCSGGIFGYDDGARLDPPAPNPPSSLSATDGTFSDRIGVSWVAPSGGGAVTNYKLYRSENPSFVCADTAALAPTVDNIAAGSTGVQDTNGVVPGKIYYYLLRAIGADGKKSECSNLDPGYAKIGAPLNLSATDGTYTNKVDVTWNPPASGQITGYELYRNTVSTACTTAVFATVSAGTTLYSDVTASPGVQYYYSIKTNSPAGLSDCAALDPGYAKISPPENVAATDGTFTDKVAVTWSPPTLGGQIDGYKIYRDTTCTSLLGTVPSSQVSYNDTTVIPGVIYNYSLKTVSPLGDSACSGTNDGFARVPAPGNLSATDGTFPTKVVVTWNAAILGSPITTYRLYRDTTPTPCLVLLNNSIPGSATSYDDTAVDPTVNYYYSIEAVAASGASSCSNVDLGFSRTRCSNGVDDDGDGKIDYRADGTGDPGCADKFDDDEKNPNGPVCDDGKDNDLDGKVDYKADGSGDPGCTDPTDNDEKDIPQCRDGKDNDGDGKIDFPADPGCSGTEDDNENDLPVCSDGLDNDGDGKTDYKTDGTGDPGCTGPNDDSEKDPNYICDNGLDDDADGRIDYRIDGSGDPGCESPTDSSEDDRDASLKSPAFAKFNTFLGQYNYAELINQGNVDKDVKLTLYNLRGEIMIERTLVVLANSEVDVDINSLVQFSCDILHSGCAGFEDLSATKGTPNGIGRPDGVVDTYGLVRFDFDDTNTNQRLVGRISFYRPNEDGTFSFAFAREFRNPSTGNTYATSNTHDPRGLGNLVPNWVEVINFGTRDSKGQLTFAPQAFTINIYNQDGSLRDRRKISLPGLGEFDVQAGHEYVDSSGKVVEGVYLVEVIPDNKNAEYFLSVARYSSNSPANVEPSSYNYALVIDGHSGTLEQLFTSISNTVEGINNLSATPNVENWVETACVDTHPCQVTVSYRGKSGGIFSAGTQTIGAKSQFHFNASAVLPKASSGSVEITSNGLIIAQSMSYITGVNNQLFAGFQSVARTKRRANQVGSINTFLNMQNVITAFSTTTSTISPTFTMTSFRGGVTTGVLTLGSAQLQAAQPNSSQFPSDTYGSYAISSPNEGQVMSEIKRIRVDSKGQIDFVMPTQVK